MRTLKPIASLFLLLNLLSASVTAWSLHEEITAAPGSALNLRDLLPLSVLLLILVASASYLVARKLSCCRHETEKFRLFLSQASDGIYILNESGQVIEASDSFCRMLGRNKEDLLGRHVSGWMREWQAGEISESVLQGYLSLTQVSTFESEQVRADGQVRAIEASVTGFSMHGRRHLFVCVREVEQRKRWEDMRKRLSAIVAASEDALVSCDGEGRVSSWNPAAERLFGFSEEEACGQAVETLLGLPTPIALAQKIRQAIWGESVLRHQSTARNKQGEEQSVTFTISPLRNADQRVAGVSLCIRNVTEQKAVETLLHLQSTALKASDDAILIAAVDGKVVWANPAYSRLSGYAKGQTIGRRYHDLDHWEREEPDFFASLMRGLHDGRIWRGETASRRKDGTEYYEEQSITPFHDDQGKVSYFIAIKRDISARRQTELALEAQQQHLEAEVRLRTQALEESRQKIQLILDSSAAGLYGVGEAGELLFINRSGAAMLGYEADQLTGRSLLDCRILPDIGTPPHPLAAANAAGFAGDTLLQRADGSCFPARCESRALVLDGRRIGSVVSFIDISAQREADLAREAARTEAEQLARTKGEFLANMSHEIRTPLNGIIGAAQIGQRQSEPYPGLHRHFRRILDSGRLLLGIINDILDLSKLEAGKLQIEQQQVRMVPLVQSTLTMIGESAQTKGLQLTVDCDPQLERPCLGDPLRLSQILLNLLANAVKFTERGEIRLQLRHRDGLEIRVADTGIGMSADQLGRIFAPFEQADGSTTRRYGGTGLGLSITRSLVELMDGDIQVSSEIGRGTECLVRLPAPFVDEEQVSLPLPPLAFQSSNGRQRLGSMRVLVADDNEINRLVIEEMLLAEGAEVSLVGDGREAVAAITAAPAGFDIVLMDVQMPELDGCEATREIRRIADHPPIIAQTAHALAEERQRCLDAGMLDQLSKPIDQEELVRTLLRYARPNQLPKRSETTPPDAPPASLQADPVTSQIDWEALQARYASKPQFIARLLKAAQSSHTDAIEGLRLAISTEDGQRIGRIAHGLKGSAGTLFAHRVLALARETEQCSHAFCPSLATQAEKLLHATLALQHEAEDYLQQACGSPPTTQPAPAS